jgi:hypothetical protein
VESLDTETSSAGSNAVGLFAAVRGSSTAGKRNWYWSCHWGFVAWMSGSAVSCVEGIGVWAGEGEHGLFVG